MQPFVKSSVTVLPHTGCQRVLEDWGNTVKKPQGKNPTFTWELQVCNYVKSYYKQRRCFNHFFLLNFKTMFPEIFERDQLYSNSKDLINSVTQYCHLNILFLFHTQTSIAPSCLVPC